MSLRASAYYPLHYGREYLAYSIRSIYDQVDRIFLVYSIRPTWGTANTWPNPDSLQDLQAAVGAIADPQRKIEWHIDDYSGIPGYNNIIGTNLCFQVAGSDICLNVDHDEIFDSDSLAEVISAVARGQAYRYRLDFVHLWRSFNWVCTDQMMPLRLRKKNGQGEAYLHTSKPVYHFGYAQRPALIDYKMSIHSHRTEFRWPAKWWLELKFMSWQPGSNVEDVHPVVHDIWDPKPFDKNELPKLMRKHPHWDVEIIK